VSAAKTLEYQVQFIFHEGPISLGFLSGECSAAYQWGKEIITPAPDFAQIVPIGRSDVPKNQ